MTFLDDALTERIAVEARQVHFWRTVLTVIAGLLYGVGWVTYRSLSGLWFAAAWCGAAVKVGWVEARRPQRSSA